MKIQSDELQSCPFCLSNKPSLLLYKRKETNYMAQVVCTECRARGSLVTGMQNKEDAKICAISKWNTLP